MPPKPSSSLAWPRWVSLCCPSSPAQHPHPHKQSPATLSWRYEKLLKKKPTEHMNCMITWLFSHNSVPQSDYFFSLICSFHKLCYKLRSHCYVYVHLIGPECISSERASSCTVPPASPPHLRSFSITTRWTHTSHASSSLSSFQLITPVYILKHFEIVSFHFSSNSLDACFYGNSQSSACDSRGRSWLPGGQCIRLYTACYFLPLKLRLKVLKHPDV